MMANFKLAKHYANGMIFQRRRPVCIEGEAEIACTLTACLHGDSVTVPVKAGEFCLQLPPREAGKGLVLTVTDGNETVTLNDIFIGEVWLAGGQSNMEWPLGICAPDECAPIKVNDDIRFYTVGRNLLQEYAAGYEWAFCGDSGWAGCSEGNAPHFSAVAYHFAHTLYEQLQIPVGIISCNLGGSSIFSWLPEKSFLRNETIRPVWDAQQKLLAETDPDAAREKFYKGLDDFKPEWAGKQPNISGTAHQDVIVFTVTEPGPYFYHAPGALYASMLERVVRFPVKGMIWYQGETNAHPEHTRMYPSALRELIANNKSRQWDNPADYAFHMVQLAPWEDANATGWADFFNMQRQFLLDNPQYGVVTIGDLGAGTDIHPPRKQKVGERLAYAAMDKNYGIPREFCGPIAVAAEKAGDEIRITLTHNEGMHQQGDMGVFEVVSASGETAEAEARLQHGCVYLSLGGICFNPVKVRYEYASNPAVGLYNKHGIPASVFCLDIAYN
jgi:sialate O-acetylesterase